MTILDDSFHVNYLHAKERKHVCLPTIHRNFTSRKESPESSVKSPRLPDSESLTSSSPEPRSTGGAIGSKPSTGQSKITDFVTRARKTLGSPEVAASARTAASPPKANSRKPTKLFSTTATSKGRTTTQKNAGEKSKSANGGEESDGSRKRGHKVAVVEKHATRSRKLSKTTDKGTTTKRLKVIVTTKTTR